MRGVQTAVVQTAEAQTAVTEAAVAETAEAQTAAATAQTVETAAVAQVAEVSEGGGAHLEVLHMRFLVLWLTIGIEQDAEHGLWLFTILGAAAGRRNDERLQQVVHLLELEVSRLVSGEVVSLEVRVQRSQRSQLPTSTEQPVDGL